MNMNKIKKIYLKELLELYRDKRTLFSTILLPIILYPLIFIGASSLMQRQTQKLQEETKVVALENFDVQNYENQETIDLITNIRNGLESDENIKIYPDSTELDSLIKDGTIHAIVRLDSISSSQPSSYYFQFRYDRSDDKAEMALKELKKHMSKFEKDLLHVRVNKLSGKELDDSFLNPFHEEEVNLASSQQMMGMIMGRFLPYLLIMLLITGGAVVATDLVAGEKERKTLETLLVSAVSRNEIVVGKFLTIVTASLVNVVVNMASMYFSFKHLLSQNGVSAIGANIPVSAFVWILLSLLPVVLFFSAVLLIISTYSRNMKEARSYESPIIMVSMMLAMISMFPGFEMNIGIAFIPVINIALLFKEIMLSGVNYLHFGVTVGSTILLNIIAIYMTIKVFNTENVLFRTQTETSFKGLKKNKFQLINPGMGMLLYFVAILLMYYIGFSWQREGLVDGKVVQSKLMLGLVKSQILLLGLPVLLLVRTLYAKKKDEIQNTLFGGPAGFLRYNKTKIANFLLIPIATIPALVMAAWLTKLVDLLFPIPENQFGALVDLMSGQDAPLHILILVIAVVPAIFEEALFRGLLPRFFEKKGVWLSIIATGVMFAIFHLDVYKIIPISLLGIWLGYLLYSTKSIFSPMLAHFLNNAVGILLAQSFIPLEMINKYLEGTNVMSISVLIAAIAIFVGVNALIYKINNGFEKIEEVN